MVLVFDQTMDVLNKDLEKLEITGHRAAGYRRLYSSMNESI